MTLSTNQLLNLAVVIIGRNEGERLRRCLGSQLGRAALAVYVDSGSTDGSVEMARKMGVEIVELDRAIPFSAARARNEGFARVRSRMPAVEFVQFVDGDCEVVKGWLDAAVDAMNREPRLGVVCGRLRERFPEASVYNRICQMEWDVAPGEIESSGGIFMARAQPFDAVGRFDTSVTAGEEPELCQRLRDAGWTIRRLTDEMALHDAAMLHFGQWWRRQVRTGYNGLDVATRFGRGRDGLFVASVRSARIWGLGIPALQVTAIIVGLIAHSAIVAAIGIAIVAALVGLQIGRIAVRIRHTGISAGLAVQYAMLTMISKFANVVGQRRYLRDRAAGRAPALIEHKTPAAT